MAVGYARGLAPEGTLFGFAGLAPRRRVDAMAAHVMRRAGFFIGDLTPRRLTERLAREADLIILLAGEDERVGPLPCPTKVVRWDIEDPLGWPVDVYEQVQDDIRARVVELVAWAAQAGMELAALNDDAPVIA